MTKEKAKKDGSKNTPAIANEPVLKKYSREEIKEILFRTTTMQGDADNALFQLANGLFSKWKNGTPAEQSQVKKEFEKQAKAVLYGFEAETHIALMECFSERLRGSAKEICKQFIRDFECKNSTEKILAETAAIAFMRYLDASRRLNNCLDVNEYLSPTKTAYMAMLSKERDRAHRQYLSTISTLKQLKAPTIEMNIKTKNTFVAQNQQINANNPTESNKNENNESK